ncbi:uncharacterized protein LOC121378230 isoform X2 [Gigantopelta aegis]|uniref:uncharacterized protein LOC121378230 isoform X2 n=1 Tax=Gigantopelta aegis TaxID=1735272 RepID=UPI001B888E17|nr:uncharacterized protein LOC121378230 isoform X2 [Gigantopelta aegis]
MPGNKKRKVAVQATTGRAKRRIAQPARYRSTSEPQPREARIEIEGQRRTEKDDGAPRFREEQRDDGQSMREEERIEVDRRARGGETSIQFETGAGRHGTTVGQVPEADTRSRLDSRQDTSTGRHEVWIIGSSIVHWAGIQAQTRPGGGNLGLQQAGICVKWYGNRGMRWSQLDQFILGKLQHQTPPNSMILQLGSNDMVTVKNRVLIQEITCSVLRLRSLLPSVRIIWSNMLPRLYWHGAEHPKQVDKARKRVNGAVKALVLAEGGGGGGQ